MRLQADILGRKAKESDEPTSRMAADQGRHSNVGTVASKESFDIENSGPIYQVRDVVNALQILHTEFTSCADIGGQATRAVRPDNSNATARRQVFIEDVSVFIPKKNKVVRAYELVPYCIVCTQKKKRIGLT